MFGMPDFAVFSWGFGPKKDIHGPCLDHTLGDSIYHVSYVVKKMKLDEVIW